MFKGNWQIKRVTSSTGPYKESVLSDAIRMPASISGETTLLWSADPVQAGQLVKTSTNFGKNSWVSGGWKEGHSYRFKLIHRPKVGLIRLQLWEGDTKIADSGDILDDGPESLRGGRLGVYCDSQEQITWSALSYR